MADAYVDNENGSDANSGADWDNAEKTDQAGMDTAGAGFDVYIKTSATATDNPDTAAASRTIVSPGTISSPQRIFGCKTGTTATPPVEADFVSKGDADQPILQCTGSNNDLKLDGNFYIRGIKISASDILDLFSLDDQQIYEDCIIVHSATDPSGTPFLIGGASGSSESSELRRFINCDVDISRAGSELLIHDGCLFEWWGGTWITAATIMFDGSLGGRVDIVGVDLDVQGSNTFADASNAKGFDLLIRNCDISLSTSLTTGTWLGRSGRVRVVNCNASDGISTSVIGYAESSYAGTIDHNTARKRTGGASDGALGEFSIAMLPATDINQFPAFSLRSPNLIPVWLDGTETNIRIHFANSLSESSPTNDAHENEIYAEVLSSSTSPDTAQYVLASNKMDHGATPPEWPDDTSGSAWGSGANNEQFMDIPITPGYEGLAYVYVHCCERATPRTFYIDPLPVLS